VSATLRVGFDATAVARPNPTGIGLSIAHLVRALRDEQQSAETDLELDVLYRISRVRRRRHFLPGPYHLFHERLSVLRARRLTVFHGADSRLPSFSGPALVATVHDLSARRPGFASERFRRTRETHWAQVRDRADLVITYTEAVKREITHDLGLDPSRIAVVPLAATDALATPPPKAEAKAVALRIAGDRPYVLCLGELSRRKNTVGAVEAFAAAGASDHALVLVGPQGRGAEDVEAAISRLGLKERVVLASYLPPSAVACLLSEAGALLFPSRYEGFGMPVLEAFRAQIPVIASTAESVIEVCGDAALHSDPDDTAGLGDDLRRVLGDDALCADLVKRGSARLNVFSWTRAAKDLVRVYRAAAARGPAPSATPEETQCNR
jgi:glycosyltransferase involved in cell wall biosynthesis